MQSAIYQEKYSAILYDTDHLPRPHSQWLDPEYWDSAQCLAEGRGRTWKINTQWGDAVLKHYHRGGMLASILKDRYFFHGWEQSRSWHEWRVLAYLHKHGLPVPKPWLAYTLKQGKFCRCDLITSYLPQTKNLKQCLQQNELDRDIWINLGKTLHAFCAAGVEHADLNLMNILLDESETLYFIDFDKARLTQGKAVNPQNQIKRLLRSYSKLYDLIQRQQNNHCIDASAEQVQHWLIEAYQAAAHES